MKVRSIDVYATYRCNLRCSHCFVGESLNLNTDFDQDLLNALIETASGWGTEEITFLGGEPTLYPTIVDTIKWVQSSNMKARLVTNGHTGFERFMTRFDGGQLPTLCFSIDGSTPEQHDLIRGKGSFNQLVKNIKRSKELGYQSSAIVSLNRNNMKDAKSILKLCEQFGFQYVNVHYVTNRGFATTQSVPSVREWQDVYDEIQLVSNSLQLDMRVERTFIPRSEFSGSCSVRDQSNLMVFPDGRVFMCAMFIDVPNAHSFTWTMDGLVENNPLHNERKLCLDTPATHCPAMQYVNPQVNLEAKRNDLAIRCIYEKSRLYSGKEVEFNH